MPMDMSIRQRGRACVAVSSNAVESLEGRRPIDQAAQTGKESSSSGKSSARITPTGQKS